MPNKPNKAERVDRTLDACNEIYGHADMQPEDKLAEIKRIVAAHK